MLVKKLHHVAYRCKDAKETAEFYTKLLGLDYSMAVSEERVPSTGQTCPYMHIFFEMEDGSCVAFFELPEEPDMQKDPNTPEWVQHLALEVATEEELLSAKKHLEDNGVSVIGPTDHTICKSIYFFDPNGHRLELTLNTMTPKMVSDLKAVSEEMLEEWDRTKRHVKQADWVHENV